MTADARGLGGSAGAAGAGPGLRIARDGDGTSHQRTAAPLVALIADEIIPRLIRAHGEGTPREAALSARTPGPADVETLAMLSLASDGNALLDWCEQWLARGVGVPRLLLELVGPAACRLGEYWEQDRADFIEVTLAMGRLQQLVLAVAQRNPGIAPPAASPHRALFAPVPGEQHSLGALIIEEIFRRSGWETTGVRAATPAALLAAVAAQPLDLVGLSVSCARFVPALSGLIGAIRRTSRNPALIVMTGGPVFANAPELAEDVGADLCVTAAERAVALCEARLAAIQGTHTARA